MGYEAMANDTVPSMAVGKKKRVNRSAKLRQSKLDARREQWLSQVKGKDDCDVRSAATSPHLTGTIDTKRRAGEEDREDVRLQTCSDFDSLRRNPAIGNHRRNSSPSGRSSSVDSTSGSVSDAEEEEKGVLDDWEAVADALCEEIGIYDHHHHRRHSEPAASPGIQSEATRGGSTAKQEHSLSTPRAWRPHDTFLPQSLLGNADCLGRAPQQKGILPLPIPCPICCEDLDLTDSSFLPCPCGFRLCLFCHKRILETDGRCPGCRKQYDPMWVGAMEINMGGSALVPLRSPSMRSSRH